jgi:hypothetical protein
MEDTNLLDDIKDVLSVAGGEKEFKVGIDGESIALLVGGIFVAMLGAIILGNLIMKK